VNTLGVVIVREVIRQLKVLSGPTFGITTLFIMIFSEMMFFVGGK